jgi:hypothetical protein
MERLNKTQDHNKQLQHVIHGDVARPLLNYLIYYLVYLYYTNIFQMIFTTWQPLFPVNYRHRIQLVRTGTPVALRSVGVPVVVVTPQQ